MEIMSNPFRGKGLAGTIGMASGEICTDPGAVQALFALCPVAAATPLLDVPELAERLNLAGVLVKDERGRMGLGSFKAMGAAHAIAKQAARAKGADTSWSQALSGQTFVCASAGNHGLSVAAGARLFGADAVVYLAETVPEGFAGRLREKGATVVREGAEYEASMAAAMRAAADNGWSLLSDSSWAGYSDPAHDVMEGYLIIGAEVATQTKTAPTHIFLQAGVGGLAAAMAATARRYWGDGPKICVVEPAFAPALFESIRAGRPVVAGGPVSDMGRLDCKEPSHLALKYLAQEADAFMTITEAEGAGAVELLARHGIATTSSGAAGLAGLMAVARGAADLTPDATVLLYVSEGV